jgi:hypothetical protein
MFCDLNGVNLARLNPGGALVYNSGRQYLTGSAYASQQRHPFSVAVLYRRLDLSRRLQCLRKDALCAVCDADKEALLIYIVGIARVNVVLLHF